MSLRCVNTLLALVEMAEDILIVPRSSRIVSASDELTLILGILTTVFGGEVLQLVLLNLILLPFILVAGRLPLPRDGFVGVVHLVLRCADWIAQSAIRKPLCFLVLHRT